MTEKYNGPERRQKNSRMRQIVDHLNDQLEILTAELEMLKEEYLRENDKINEEEN